MLLADPSRQIGSVLMDRFSSEVNPSRQIDPEVHPAVLVKTAWSA